MALKILSVLLMLPLLPSYTIAPALADDVIKPMSDLFRLVVVGDTGIGNDAFHEGFQEVQRAMVEEKPHLLLHVGDYIYNADGSCRNEDLAELEKSLVEPFNGAVVFARGDNDAESEFAGCWAQIATHNKLVDKPSDAREWEGVVDRNDFPLLIVVLDHDGFKTERDRKWLDARIQSAKRRGKWILVLVHDPVVNTSWYDYPCCESLRPFQDMGVDLVISGHQHSFERTLPVHISASGKLEPLRDVKGNVYNRGDGVVYVIAGGGGALLRPFNDQQACGGEQKKNDPCQHKPPEEIRAVVGRRAIANHYVRVELTTQRVAVKAMLVCFVHTQDPRWHADNRAVWGYGARLECDGRPPGIWEYDSFEIVRQDVK